MNNLASLYQFNETQIVLFALVLLRISAFVVVWPVFSAEQMTAQLKILFALTITMVVFPTQIWKASQIETITSNLIILSVREVFIGICCGYLAKFFFFTFQIAGELASTAMGLNAAQIFNPALGGNSTAIEHFYTTLAALFYLAVNGHHYLLKGMIDSLTWLPVGSMSLNTSQFIGVGNMVQEIIEFGLRMSAPVVIAILVANLVMGVIGKTVPQMNVLVTSMPVNIFIGLVLLFVTMPLFVDQMDDFLVVSTTRVFQMMRSF
jgi:flagellar biosynthetic protein FliR